MNDQTLLIVNANIVNEGQGTQGDVFIRAGRDGVQKADEGLLLKIVDESMIGPDQQFSGGFTELAQRLEDPLHFGHIECGGNTFSGDVSNDNSYPAVRQLDKIEIVSADLHRRLRYGGNLVASARREFLREQAPLHILCDHHFLFVSFSFKRLGDQPGVLNGDRHMIGECRHHIDIVLIESVFDFFCGVENPYDLIVRYQRNAQERAESDTVLLHVAGSSIGGDFIDQEHSLRFEHQLSQIKFLVRRDNRNLIFQDIVHPHDIIFFHPFTGHRIDSLGTPASWRREAFTRSQWSSTTTAAL